MAGGLPRVYKRGIKLARCPCSSRATFFLIRSLTHPLFLLLHYYAYYLLWKRENSGGFTYTPPVDFNCYYERIYIIIIHYF